MGYESLEDQAMFITEKCYFRDLVDGPSSPCLWANHETMKLESFTQVNIDDMHAHVNLHVHVHVHASNCFHLLPLSPAKDMIKYVNSQWTLPGQPKVVY